MGAELAAAAMPETTPPSGKPPDCEIVPFSRQSFAPRPSVLAVGVGALALGFLGFTALGVGGGSDAGSPPPALPSKPVIVIAPREVGRGNDGVARAESIGVRENGGAGDPSTPLLSERIPHDAADFDAPIAAFRKYSAKQVRRMRDEVDELAAAIGRGDRAGAQDRWRAAFASYQRLGNVYGAFGDLDAEIAGLPGSLPGGERDPDFVGLHRLARDLWGTEPVRALAPIASRLQRAAARLPRAVREGEITPLDYALRAHEILENAQRDFLTGDRVPWSDEGVLATAGALDATIALMRTLHPLIKGAQVDGASQAGMARLRTTLVRIRSAHGGAYPPLAGLSLRERQQLVGSTGWLLERLQHVPEAAETVDPPAIPPLDTP